MNASSPFDMECRAQAWVLFAPAKMSLSVNVSLCLGIQDDGINLVFALQLCCCCLGVTCMCSVHTPCHIAVVQFFQFYLYTVFNTKPAFSGGEFNTEMRQFLKQCFQPTVKIYVTVSILSPFIQRKYLK